MRETLKYILAAVATAAMAADDVIEGVAASVNGETITIGETMGGLQEQLKKMSAEPDFTSRNRQEIFDEAFKRSLDNLIARRLIIQSYYNGSARIPDGVFDKQRAEIVEKDYGGDNSKLRAELAERRISYDDWKKQVEEVMIYRAMRQSMVNGNINVSPNEIRREYEARKDEFRESFAASFSLFGVKSDPRADALLADFSARVAAGENFDALGEAFSTNAIAFFNSYEMCDPSESVSPAILDALRALKNGEVSQPVAVGSQRFVIRMNELRLGRELTLREAVEKVGDDIRMREADRLYDAWVARLREAAAIKYFKHD